MRALRVSGRHHKGGSCERARLWLSAGLCMSALGLVAGGWVLCVSLAGFLSSLGYACLLPLG